ncbi:tripartite motif-containing protein 2-like [Cimex lectularius]|uniref:Uncharacterized protein n=1 Tax=Cimex lectularius TaxID=79782 RepID=A0A8I6S503_CIMLE|nr:tripartite motif-containing protein 2-like [Cimex lectularius]XP_014256173.1 tripartite motif-containing protein 2-like [Cimex lectularius]
MALLKSPVEQDSAYDSPSSWEFSLSPSSPRNQSLPKPLHSSQCSITCTACNKTYTSPRVLPCLHTFCTKCLETTKKTVNCPICNIDFCLPQAGVQGLIPDYGMMNFIRSLKGNLYCTSCRTDSTGAVAKCINCDNYLCHNCLLAHSNMHCFEGHRVIQFPKDFLFHEEGEKQEENELLNMSKDEDGTVQCITHKEQSVKYFCLTCNEPICQVCLTEEHVGHRSDPIDAIGEALLSVMSSTMEENKSRLEDLAMSIKYSRHTDWWLNSQYQEIHNRINDVYNQYNSMLLRYKQQQVQLLESSFNKLKGALHNNSNLSQDTYEKTNRLTDFFSRLTKFGTVTQCLMFKKLLEGKHKRLATYKPKPLQCHLKFVADAQDFNSVLNSTFGRVVSDISGHESEIPVPRIGQLLNIAKEYFSQGGTFPFKYDRWSNTCLEDLKAISEIGLCSEDTGLFRPYNSLKSTVSRQVITYNWKFGCYGTMQGQFTEPNGVAVNAEGDIIIADTNNNRVQVFDKMGRFKFLFGEGSNSTDGGSLLFPNRVAVMEKTGDIVVTERAPTHQVQIYNQYGQFKRKFGANILQHPRAVTVDKDGYIIVVECKVMRVVIFDQSGEVVHKFTCNTTLHFPNGVAVNDKRQIFISDNRTHCVVVYDYRGNFVRHIGREGLTNYPIGVMLNKVGQVIVADNHNNFNLTIFTQEGQLVTAVESKVKHAQCYDAAISSDGTVVLTSKDYRVYIYLTNF